ncbi:hypothetical protein HPB50_017606 [Hyalomma asiaticum]|uniref:Uncharacterized protein n=1 Tax=Hyalomma asiaticum TaxID=266040 RepID=A0ACB7TK81_HYAAI|nr:hypothetical protein HPB50_017606 [Hyalomma asiaticum]
MCNLAFASAKKEMDTKTRPKQQGTTVSKCKAVSCAQAIVLRASVTDQQTELILRLFWELEGVGVCDNPEKFPNVHTMEEFTKGIKTVDRSYEMKRLTDVDMFIAAAWVVRSPAMITNCFTHAGLVTRQASCTDPAEQEEGSPAGALNDSTVPLSLTSAWGKLCKMAKEIPDGLSIDVFICADEHAIVHKEMTNEAIISSACEVGDPEAGNTDDPRPQPEKRTTPEDVLNALDIIRLFFGEHGDDVAMDHFLQCE